MDERQLSKEAERLWNSETEDPRRIRSVELFRQAFDNGEHSLAAYRLGYAYYSSTAVARDLDKAFEYLSHSSQEGSRMAHYYRGLIYSDRRFSNFDMQRAYQELTHAETLGLQVARDAIIRLDNEKARGQAADRSETLIWSDCSICGADLGPARAGEGLNCPGCGARPRTRTLPTLLKEEVLPLIGNANQNGELLAFSMTSSEEPAICDVFPNFHSVSYAGKYRRDHEEGVDIRDLSRFADSRFSGIYGLFVFDYFVEIEQALAESARVLEDGGILFTAIADYRLLEGAEPPKVERKITPRAGYLDYFPDDLETVTIKVGKDWLLSAMRQAGFSAHYRRLSDAATDTVTDWFVGVKATEPAQRSVGLGERWLASLERQPKVHDFPSQPPASQPSGRDVSPSTASLTKPEHMGELKEYSIPLPEASGFGLLKIRLSVPDLPSDIRHADFAEHVFDPGSQRSSDTVIVAATGKIGISEDLGATWRTITVPGAEKVRFWNCFTTSSCRHLIQSVGWQGATAVDQDVANKANIFVFDKHWNLLSRTKPGDAYWHGNASIDQSGGTVMFGEYFNNSEARQPDFDENREQYLSALRSNRILRSRDDGATWAPVLEYGPLEIRHFHTVVADPFQVGVWWASSGDRHWETRIWCSKDDGDSWRDVTNSAPDVALPSIAPEFLIPVQRYTDIIVAKDYLLWGSDDILGSEQYIDPSFAISKRTGSRLFVSPKSNPVVPREIGFAGHEIRKLIDVGPGWIILTEATNKKFGFRPSAHILFKENFHLIKLFDLDNYAASGTGFTYSRGSRASKDGIFFTYRGTKDVFPDNPAHILKWEVSFE